MIEGNLWKGSERRGGQERREREEKGESGEREREKKAERGEIGDIKKHKNNVKERDIQRVIKKET